MDTIFQLFITSFIILLTLTPKFAGGSSIGVCYGMLGDNLPSPPQVVALYQSNHIQKMRLYDPNPSALEALRGSGIQVLVGVRNEDIENIASSADAADDWVRRNIRSYWPDVHFRYIAVGNEVIPGSYAQFVLPAMQNIHNALRIGGLWDRIKVSTAVSTSVMGVSYPPSAGAFSDSSINYMKPIVRYLASNGAPLLANVYPYFSYVADPKDISLAYALFTAKTDVVRDDGLGYRNLFDATIDALYASLEKAGAAQVEVVVSETGWPSAGNGETASIRNAQFYNSKLVQHPLSSRGTPRRPGRQVETYLFAMFNEDRKEGDMVERHWGLFYPNMKPVYPLNFH